MEPVGDSVEAVGPGGLRRGYSMHLRRWVWIALAIWLGAQVGMACGPVPTDPEGGAETDDRVYRNEQWGFQVTLPADSSWVLNAQSFLLNLDINGLPRVLVRIWRPSGGGDEVQPMLVLEPRALAREATLDTLATFLEAEFKGSFPGYRILGEKQRIEVGSEAALEWGFTTRPVEGLGDHYLAERFLATAVLHNRQVYVILSSGSHSVFPLAGFRQIVSSLEFLK